MPNAYKFVRDESSLPVRRENDVYNTDLGVIRAYLKALTSRPSFRVILSEWAAKGELRVLDIGAGDGRWGREVKAHLSKLLPGVFIELWGIEIREEMSKPNDYLVWFNLDIEDMLINPIYDLIVGNPPYYNLDRTVPKLLRCLTPFGHLGFLLSIDFGHGINRRNKLFTNSPLMVEMKYSKRVKFYGSGSPFRNHCMFCWQKKGGKFLGIPREWNTILLNHEQIHNIDDYKAIGE